MTTPAPDLLALDFDGVLCDGLLEYFQTAWQVYRRLWTPPDSLAPTEVADLFYRLRPVVETGWEMPLLVSAIVGGVDPEAILADWWDISRKLLAESGFSAPQLAGEVDRTRDAWIARDLEGWLQLHRLYPGVDGRLRALCEHPQPAVFIITTKESRFVLLLLEQAGVAWPGERIFGKDIQQPKTETLAKLLGAGYERIWFVEDRLVTLEKVARLAELAPVQLYLADWGYNTPAERERARADSRIHLLNLEQFADDFCTWPR
ncbi:HAD family hydrolase [Gloeobacter morelensis]|uniref:HAD family hydrolase n=1 Tax=Gloeobacter morelensis MG652769 TaxID=2781736 RepID=A0ABY3PHW2_9CYAN|nr:HAD family hydrolase [Gloeobacter morelensis]UFP93174.1 HAD family hydrolase [Gloeobacter morelensis MG652769]